MFLQCSDTSYFTIALLYTFHCSCSISFPCGFTAQPLHEINFPHLPTFFGLWTSLATSPRRISSIFLSHWDSQDLTLYIVRGSVDSDVYASLLHMISAGKSPISKLLLYFKHTVSKRVRLMCAINLYTLSKLMLNHSAMKFYIKA